jgi:hypothetical protein
VFIHNGPAQPCLAQTNDDSIWKEVEFLYEGRFADGEKALISVLEQDAANRQARFGLGVTQFLGAGEHLMQNLYKYGLSSESTGLSNLPFLRLPIPKNPDPDRVSAADLRAMLRQFVADLDKADQTLKALDESEVKLQIDLSKVQFDIDRDGTARDEEKLAAFYNTIVLGDRGAASGDADQPPVVVFDRGDVAWFRGYGHLLSALVESILTYDMHDLFEHTAHLAFAKPVTPFDFLAKDTREGEIGFFADLIAGIHLCHFPLKEPERMKSALAHLEACIALSRETWKLYQAETDDDHEWIPNATQSLFLRERGRVVTREMITGWTEFLDEFEAILAGKKLVPFWRFAGGKGINLRRVFTEPREFDLVLWVQGTSALPYLEEGPITKPEVWERLQNTFGGQFFGFAAWFN